jgi:hypothetical protein
MITNNTITFTAQLTVTTCWCGVHVGIPANLDRQARETGKEIYCPLGHTFVYKETEVERLRREAQTLRECAAAERDLRADTERRLRAQKAATTRAKRRHAAGVCPCCNRTFQQLARHMKTKHPDYDPQVA